MESWRALQQKNVLDQRRWATRDELRHAVVFKTKHTYNRRRWQRLLGKLTPVEYELAFTPDRLQSRLDHHSASVNRYCSGLKWSRVRR